MSEPRVIKKYPNRRLYDTVESRYITLADVERLVVERIDFVVVDKKNNADITRSILLQVIAEQEHLAEPILSQDFMVECDPLLRRQHAGAGRAATWNRACGCSRLSCASRERDRPRRSHAVADQTHAALAPRRR